MKENLLTVDDNKVLGKEFFIDNYDKLCQEHFKIKKIIPLKRPKWKYILDIILSITIIKFYIYEFFPEFAKFMKYEVCDLDEADFVAIYCNDDKLYFEELKKINLPNVENSYIVTSQLNYSRKCYLISFKLFNYIYNPFKHAFNSVNYSIYCTKEQIFEFMSKGLTKDERQYQSLIYGECDLNFKINSFFFSIIFNYMQILFYISIIFYHFMVVNRILCLCSCYTNNDCF